jgi:hypothetical protein
MAYHWWQEVDLFQWLVISVTIVIQMFIMWVEIATCNCFNQMFQFLTYVSFDLLHIL